MNNNSAPMSSVRRIAIVGSGLAGLTAGLRLQRLGHDVTLFEKSRGPGGRLAAKRVPGGSADVGAQYFTARNPGFLPFLREYGGKHCFAEWHGRFGFRDEHGQWGSFPDEPRYVGTPRMTAITRALSEHLRVTPETRIEHFARVEEGWQVFDTEGSDLGTYDQIIITAPPAQARDLLKQSQLHHLAAKLDDPVQKVLPCWAVAAHFAESPWTQHEGMRLEHPVLYWVGNNSSKPKREDAGQWWVLHANPEWTQAHVDTPAEQVAELMLAAFQDIAGFTDTADDTVTHRWLYARSRDGEQPGHLWFSVEGIGLAGDWLAGGRVEGAFDSASGLVTAMTKGS
ncbi:NAD(P)/FAD-dependent oxidoreductase [Marinobacter sp.]|uniref:NAD(P)/FAD-dependent oxidoreductase n=1 Tax=Marinobacter sp. TaxID=50741 RepID=UPI0035C72176